MRVSVVVMMVVRRTERCFLARALNSNQKYKSLFMLSVNFFFSFYFLGFSSVLLSILLACLCIYMSLDALSRSLFIFYNKKPKICFFLSFCCFFLILLTSHLLVFLAIRS